MPKDLNFMHKRDRADVAKDMLSKVDSDPSFIERIITGDETWIYTHKSHVILMTRTPDIKRVNGVHPMSHDRKNHVVFS